MGNNHHKNFIASIVALALIIFVYNLIFSDPAQKIFAQIGPSGGGSIFQSGNQPVDLGPLVGENGGSAFDPELSGRTDRDQESLEQEGKSLEELQKEDEKKCLEQGGLGGILGGGGSILGGGLGGGIGGNLGGGFVDGANTTAEAISRLGDIAGLSGQNANTNRQLGQVLQGLEGGNTNPIDIIGFLTSAAGGSSDISRITNQLGQITQNGLGGRLDSAQIANLFGNLGNLDGNTLNQLERMLSSSEIAGFQAGPATDFFGNLFNLEGSSLNQLSGALNGFEQGEYNVSDVVTILDNSTNLSGSNLNQLGNILNTVTSSGEYRIDDIANLIGSTSSLGGNSLNLLSGAGGIIQESLSGNFDTGAITDFIGNLGGLDASGLSNLTNAGNLISGALDGSFNMGNVTDFIGNLGGLDASGLANLSSAGSLIEGALNGNFDIGETFDFLGGIGNLSPDALSLFGGAGNLLDGALSGNFDLGEAFDFMGNLDILSNDGLLGGLLGNSGVTGIIGNALSGDIGFGDAAGLISAIPGLDGIGSILGGVGGFGSVPVKESDGPLLSSTQQIEDNTGEIDKTTKSIEKLTVEICKYLKSIQRIQTAWEQRETVESPDIRRQAATGVEQYRQALADFTREGYAYGEDEEGPLFIQNTRGHINEIILPEIDEGYYDTLKNSAEDEFAEETISLLRQDTENAGLPKSTITKDTYEQFITGEIDDSEDWWNTFLAINDPAFANKPTTSYLLNNAALNQRRQQAEEDFLNEMVAGQGYLPVRECVERAEDSDTCLKWQVITPAIQIKEANADSFSYRQDLYTSPEIGDLAEGNEPQVEEIRTFTPSQTGGGGGSSLSQPGGGLGFDISNLINLLTSLRQNSNAGAGATDPYTRPTVSLNTSLPTLSLVQQGTANTANIRWQTSGVTECTATNNWLTRGNIPETPSVIRATGSQIGAQGSVDIPLPLTFEVTLLRERAGQLHTVTGVVSTQFNAGLTHQVNVVSMPDDILPEDRFRLALWPKSENSSAIIQISEWGATKSAMVTTFRQAIGAATSESNPNLAQRNEFGKYNFTYQTGTGTITITPKMTYGIKCENNSGESITRQTIIVR